MPDKKKKFWIELLNRHDSSHQTAKAFCLEHGVSPGSFSYWKKRLKNTDEHFSELAIVNNPSERSCLSLHVGAVEIRLHSDFDPLLLKQVIGLLA